MNFFVTPMIFVIFTSSQARQPISASRFGSLSGIMKSTVTNRKKETREILNVQKSPHRFLADNYQYIPAGSAILDLGMHEGNNSVFMARKGYRVVGVDPNIDSVKKARLLAREFGVRIDTIISSLDYFKIDNRSLDAIICFTETTEELRNKMLSWLKKDGIIIYEAIASTKANILTTKKLLKMFPETKLDDFVNC